MSEKPAEPLSREIGPPKPYRLWVDQQEWLDRMERERSVNTAALVRAAVDAYMPVYEALGDRSDEAVRRQARERFDLLLDAAAKPAEILELVETLENRRAEAAGATATAEEKESAA